MRILNGTEVEFVVLFGLTVIPMAYCAVRSVLALFG
jgi:hypothetical protein